MDTRFGYATSGSVTGSGDAIAWKHRVSPGHAGQSERHRKRAGRSLWSLDGQPHFRQGEDGLLGHAGGTSHTQEEAGAWATTHRTKDGSKTHQTLEGRTEIPVPSQHPGDRALGPGSLHPEGLSQLASHFPNHRQSQRRPRGHLRGPHLQVSGGDHTDGTQGLYRGH